MQPCRPPPSTLVGRQGADLCNPAGPPHRSTGSQTSTPRCNPVGPITLRMAGREPISAPPQAQLHWPAGSRPTPRCNPVGPITLRASREPISAAPRRPNLIGRRGADLTRQFLGTKGLFVMRFVQGTRPSLPPQSLLLGIRPLPPRPDRAQHITQIVNLCLMPLPSSLLCMSPHLAANASTVT